MDVRLSDCFLTYNFSTTYELFPFTIAIAKKRPPTWQPLLCLTIANGRYPYFAISTNSNVGGVEPLAAAIHWNL